jgi:hypothetical protein
MSLRERINSDPKLQLGLGAVLLIVVVFVLMGKGGGESAETVVEEPTAASVEATGTTPGLEGGAEESLAALSASVKAPPLPQAMTAAYEANETVAVLFVRNGGIDDRLVKLYSRFLHRHLPETRFQIDFKLFVVPVKQIGRYAALTLGMQVQRVPAFVVLRRKSLSKGGPEGSILYGYQAPARILLSVRDASYKGPAGSYHPG